MKSIILIPALLSLGVAAVSAQTPVIDPSRGVQNGASFIKGQAVAPGALVTIFGSNLATGESINSSVPLSMKLASTTVTINGITAPLTYVNTGQINAQVPWEVTGTSAQFVVTNGTVSSAPMAVSIAPSGPGIFAYCADTTVTDASACPTNKYLAIAYGNSDGLLAWATGAVAGLSTHPAKINDPTTLVILATGLGPVTPPVATGDIATDGKLHTTPTNPVVTVGGVPAQVFFSGMSPFVGVFQLNIIIQPGTPTGDNIPLQITMNGVKSNIVTIAVSN